MVKNLQFGAQTLGIEAKQYFENNLNFQPDCNANQMLNIVRLISTTKHSVGFPSIKRQFSQMIASIIRTDLIVIWYIEGTQACVLDR